MSPRRVERGFRYIIPNRATKWTVTINDVDVSDYVLSGVFTRGTIGEECTCDIELENSGENYTGAFTYGNDIIFKMDFSDGSTVQFKGYVEEITNKLQDTFTLMIKGSHLTARLLDIMVTEEFEGASVTDIFKSIVDEYLTGYTYANVETIDTSVNIKWINRPFYDCIVDLCIFGNCDSFLDNDLDFHLFTKGSKQITTDAIWEEDALLELTGLGTDSIDVRNKIQVYGASGGLPVIHTSPDTSSQTTYGVKEKVITDSSIIDEVKAKDLGDAELEQIKNPETKGSADCLFLPGLYPGCSTHVRSQPQGIHDFYRVVKYSYVVPAEGTTVVFSEERGLPKLFKERIQKDMGQETIVNPFKMNYTYNFLYNDYVKTDEESSNNITISDGKLTITSGATGNWISNTTTADASATKCQVMVKGENITGNVVAHVSFDGTDNYQKVSLDRTVNGVPSSGEISLDTAGSEPKLKLEINSTDTQIDAAVLLYK